MKFWKCFSYTFLPLMGWLQNKIMSLCQIKIVRCSFVFSTYVPKRGYFLISLPWTIIDTALHLILHKKYVKATKKKKKCNGDLYSVQFLKYDFFNKIALNLQTCQYKFTSSLVLCKSMLNGKNIFLTVCCKEIGIYQKVVFWEKCIKD